MRPDIRDQEIGRRVRARRRALNMSQDTLGAAIGVTSQQVAKYESGGNRITATRLQDIARMLKTTITVLLEESKAA